MKYADRPWQKIGADVFTLDGTDYLCVVDYYLSYFEVDRLESKTAASIAKKLRKQFSVHGIPNQLISDNMPFNSQEFKEFAASYEFEVITRSPGYSQSNGKVENTIKTAKNIMKKAKQAGTDVYLTLLDRRNTPSEGMSSSPAQRREGSKLVLKNKLTFGRTKSGLKMAICTGEIVDTFASPRNHLVRLLKPVLLWNPNTTRPHHPQQLNQPDLKLEVNQSKTPLLICPSKQSRCQCPQARSHVPQQSQPQL